MTKQLLTYILLFCSMQLVVSKTQHYERRTYFRFPQYDIGMERERSIMHQHTTTDIGNQLGVTFSLTPFVTFSSDSKNLTHYFGIRDASEIKIAVDRGLEKTATTFPYHSIEHEYDGTASAATTGETGTLNLSPSYTQAGGIVSLFQDCSHLHDGLAFLLQIPVVWTETSFGTLETLGTNTKDYFLGKFSQTETNNVQAALEYGRIKGNEHIGVGPVRMSLLLDVTSSETQSISIAAGVSASTVSSGNQTELFDAHSATQGATKLFSGLEGAFTLWDDADSTGELHCSAHYYYNVPFSQKRIIGIRNVDNSPLILPAHYLVGTKGKTGVQPAANITHQPVTIAGLHEAEICMLYAITSGRFICNIGYRLHGKQAEEVTLKEWSEGKYAIPHPSYKTDNTFAQTTTTATANDIKSLGAYISESNMDLESASAPASAACTPFIALGYSNTTLSMPVFVGIGGSYSIALNNARSSEFTVWGKLGVSF